MKHLIWLSLVIYSFSALASVCENRGPNVILFTWDGVRSHEFFKGSGVFHAHQLAKADRGEIFKNFWSKHASQGMVLGKNRDYTIGSDIAISLPSYQALMVGHDTGCRKNNCAGISESSVLENVRSSLKLDKSEVAAFASWDAVIRAVAKDPSEITHGIYPEIFDDGSKDPSMQKIQEDALTDLPAWHGGRKDKYTFDLGMSYLKKHCPRVLFISLLDSDEYGHKSDYKNYVLSLKSYDLYLDQIISTLKEMGEYGQNTTLITTTDHSRGAGAFWSGHAITPTSERHVFLYAYGRGVKPVGSVKDKANHTQIRPTIEYLMGMEPTGTILPHISIK